MTLSLPSASELAQWSLTCQRPSPWVSTSDRLTNLTDEHAFDLQLATDKGIAAQRAEHFDLGIAPDRWLNRWVKVHDDLNAMLSIRFKGMDVTQPFVDVSVTTRPLTSNDFAALREVASREYGPFQALRLRFWSPADMNEFPEVAPDLRALAAPLSELRNQPVPEGLTLSPTPDDRHYVQAQAAYGAVDAQHPAHGAQASLISREDLQDGIEAGTMFDVMWNGDWSGYAGTLPGTSHGFLTQTVQELVLAPHARGQGLGPFLSVLLAHHLPDDGSVLYGTIHGENTGARQAALAAGRVDLGGWNWLPIG